MRSYALVALVLVVLSVRPAAAAFHLMPVKEVYAGASGSQYVELEMTAPGQTFVSGHALTVYNAAGTAVDTLTFNMNLTNGAAAGAKILVATAKAGTDFSVVPDLVMPNPTLPNAGGMVCWDTYDCFAWGNFTGATPPSPVGAPFNGSTGLPMNMAARRNADTNVCSADFTLVTPAPVANALPPKDMAGQPPADMTGQPPADMSGAPAADMTMGTTNKSGCDFGGQAPLGSALLLVASMLALTLARRSLR